VQLGCRGPCVRTSDLFWILPIIFCPGSAVQPTSWLAVGPDAVRAHRPVRRIGDEFASITDPGTSYSRKKRDVETIGSAQSKRLFAEECSQTRPLRGGGDLYAVPPRRSR